MMRRACLAVAVFCLGVGCEGDAADEDSRRRPGDGLDGGGPELDAGRGDDVDGAVSTDRDAGGDPADRALEGELLDKMIACTLLPIGLEVPARAALRDDTERCIARCNIAAPCPDLEVLACDATRRGDLDACHEACPKAPADGFACGNGQRVPHLAVCDGDPDCTDATDEADCLRACDDGTTRERGLAIRCDRSDDCQDDSDGASCLLCGS